MLNSIEYKTGREYRIKKISSRDSLHRYHKALVGKKVRLMYYGRVDKRGFITCIVILLEDTIYKKSVLPAGELLIFVGVKLEEII
jgi:hypothetical protein